MTEKKLFASFQILGFLSMLAVAVLNYVSWPVFVLAFFSSFIASFLVGALGYFAFAWFL